MGAGSSFEGVRDASDISSIDISEQSSGYQSNSESRDNLNQLDCETKNPKELKMPPKLASRPSLIIGAISKKEQEREDELKNKNVKKTPELKKVFEGFEQCKKFLLDGSKRHEQFYGALNKLLHDKVIEPFSKFGADEQRMVMANELARMDFVEPLVEYYLFLYEDLKVDGVTNAFVEEAHIAGENGEANTGFLLTLTIREILWNYSDSSHRFSENISETEILRMLAFDLKVILRDGLEDMEEFQEFQDLFAFSSAVGIFHNCARNPDIDKSKFRDLNSGNPDMKKRFQDLNIVEILYPFLKSKNNYVKMITLLALGNIITDDEVSKLEADNAVIDLLMKSGVKALADKERKHHGFHLTELIDGLAAMAQSESNKKVIMSKKDLLPTLVKIIQGKGHSEILACVKLVWELAFLEENKEIMKKDKALMTAMEELKNDTDYEIKNATRSAWFVLVDQDEKRQHKEERNQSLQPGGGKHIMFSYNWGDKETVLKIYHLLVNDGYKIWIDVNEMNKYGDLLEGMARAVEEAFLVLIFFSEKYKNSPNCRTEAEYVFALGKRFIPVKMQRGFKPQGWLGALIGARLYIEFSAHYPFENQMDQLRNRIKDNDTDVSTITSPPPVKPEEKILGTVRDWSRAQLDSWIAQHKLEGSSFKQVKKLTGEQLEFLYKVMIKSPGTFYGWMETKLELKSLEDLMRFDRAINALEKSVQF